MFLPYMYQGEQKSQNTPRTTHEYSLSQHSTLMAAQNPGIRFDVRDLMKELEKDYGADGSGMNFGAILIPIFRDAANQMSSGVEVTVSQFNEILRATANFDFIDKAIKDRPAAIDQIIQQAKSLSAVA